jgi:hypothetical protein
MLGYKNSFSTGARKAIVQRGCKYPEQVGDHSKSFVLVLLAGSGAGKFLAPYVMYKSMNIYDSWCSGGPKGTVYSCSPSGWFDMHSFEDWYFKILLPAARRLEGKKILIGDNLASHISLKVIQSCRENNIEFVCLPPNATDKMQPLDVGFFGPMKAAWRAQLRKYADKDPTAKLLLKTEFPSMLKELLEALSPEKHLPTAFKKCGLVPVNREKVLERLPSIQESHVTARHLDATLLEKLEVRRFGEKNKKKPRGKKVPAHQSYSRAVEEDSEEEESDKVESEEDESEEEERELEELEAEEHEVEEREPEQREPEQDDEEELPDLDRPIAGTIVVAVYEGQWFLAEVTESQAGVAKGYTRLSYMVIKGANSFAWGSKPDVMDTLNDDIVLDQAEIVPVNSRGHLGLKQADLKRVCSWMVVVYILLYFFQILSSKVLILHPCLVMSLSLLLVP